MEEVKKNRCFELLLVHNERDEIVRAPVGAVKKGDFVTFRQYAMPKEKLKIANVIAKSIVSENDVDTIKMIICPYEYNSLDDVPMVTHTATLKEINNDEL